MQSAGEGYDRLLERLGVDIDDQTLRLALTHRSYAYENGGIPTNERLEFLGDAILGFIIADALFQVQPELPEGKLAQCRSAVVSTKALAGVGAALGIGSYILLGRGESRSKGAQKSSILADTMEALIGAAYISDGFETAKSMVLRLIGPLLEDPETMSRGHDWKTALQEAAAATDDTVVYEVVGEGPDHAKVYTAYVHLDGVQAAIGCGRGTSKKDAEQEAAHIALNYFKAQAADCDKEE